MDGGGLEELREAGTRYSSSELHDVKVIHFVVGHTQCNWQVICVWSCKHYMTCLLQHRNHILSNPPSTAY